MAFAYNSRFSSVFPFIVSGFTPTFATQLMDVQGEKNAHGLFMPQADTITHVSYYQSALANTPAAASFRMGLQAWATTGLPDGTWLGATNNGFVDFQPVAGGTGTYVENALGESVTLAQGAGVAIVLERLEANSANTITVGYGAQYFAGTERVNMPWSATHNATAWTRPVTNFPKHLMRGTYYYGDPFTAWTTAAAYGDTTENAVVFTMPSSITGTYKLAGFRYLGITPTTGTNIFTLYSFPVSGTIAILDQTAALDEDYFPDGGAIREMTVMFPTSTALTPGTQYAIGFAATSGTTGSLYYHTLAAANRPSLNMWQQTYGSRTLTDYPPSANDTANFTETTTRWPCVELIFQDMTTSAGGSGMLRHPGMNGGKV